MGISQYSSYLSEVELPEHARPRHVRPLRAQLLEQVLRQSLAGLEVLGELHRGGHERERGNHGDRSAFWFDSLTDDSSATMFLQHTCISNVE